MIFLIITFIVMILLSILCFIWTACVVSKNCEECEDHEENEYFIHSDNYDSDFWND